MKNYIAVYENKVFDTRFILIKAVNLNEAKKIALKTMKQFAPLNINYTIDDIIKIIDFDEVKFYTIEDNKDINVFVKGDIVKTLDDNKCRLYEILEVLPKQDNSDYYKYKIQEIRVSADDYEKYYTGDIMIRDESELIFHH